MNDLVHRPVASTRPLSSLPPSRSLRACSRSVLANILLLSMCSQDVRKDLLGLPHVLQEYEHPLVRDPIAHPILHPEAKPQ